MRSAARHEAALSAPGEAPRLRSADAAAALPSHDARRLTGSRGEAEIVLDGAAYRLRITRAGKLILTK